MKFLGTQKKIFCHLEIIFDLKLKDLYKHKYKYLWHVLVFHEFYRKIYDLYKYQYLCLLVPRAILVHSAQAPKQP